MAVGDRVGGAVRHRWVRRGAVAVGGVLLALVLTAPAYAGDRVMRVKVSTYGWPGDSPFQPLAGCGYRKINAPDAGGKMPCRLSPRLAIMAVVPGFLKMGLRGTVCYGGNGDGVPGRGERCAWFRAGDRCGPGCYANGVKGDLSHGVARLIGFPWTVDYVTIRIPEV